MKSAYLFLLFISFISVGNLFAQTSIGLKAGFTQSSANYRTSLGTYPRDVTGFNAPSFSLVIEQFFEKHAGGQVELQFLTTGYAATDSINMGNETRFTYLKVPVLSNFYLGNSGRFHIKIGPHLGYLLKTEDVERVIEGDLVIPTYGQESDTPRKIMYGLTAGVGLSKLFGKHTVQGEVRYSYEFGNPEAQERIFDLNFTQLEFSLAYLFRVAN